MLQNLFYLVLTYKIFDQYKLYIYIYIYIKETALLFSLFIYIELVQVE